MFDSELNIDAELPAIPPEYQDIFRQALEREMAEAEQNRTDSDILAYLRTRRQDFKRGGFIRPDGRSGLVALNPETLYEQALPQLAQSTMEKEDEAVERRRTLLKLGLFAGVALLFLFVVLRSRAQHAAESLVEGTPEVAAAEETAAAQAAAGGVGITPTPPLPEMSGAADALQTIGSLGGALTIGRPSAIELTYRRTEETIALPIDPSQPTAKGEMRYSEATMLSDNPVAVWLFGTVLNYAIGLPQSLVQNLAPGDRIRLSTDTGAALQFVVAETGMGASHEAPQLLSQNRLGLTLFALPAASEGEVAFVRANYDLTSEAEQGPMVYEVGEPVGLGETRLQVNDVAFDATITGDIRVAISGTAAQLPAGATLLVSLSASQEQTAALTLRPDASDQWQAAFVLPATVTGQPLLAELRLMPGGQLGVVRLGSVPRLIDQLAVSIGDAWQDVASGQMVLSLTVHNAGAGAVRLDESYIQLPQAYQLDAGVVSTHEGGDAYEVNVVVAPRPSGSGGFLPLLLEPGQTAGLTVTFIWPAPLARLQIGADLWELAIPDGMASLEGGAEPTGLPNFTDQQPVSGGE